MKKNNKTKKALIASFVSLVICITAFIGATFAWFTDSEASGTNKIQSGNLDIVLEYSKTLEDGSWKKVTEETNDLFTDLEGNDMLWEPGATSVVYLKITNAGTLALKYNLGVNVASELAGKNVNNETFKLSDYIMFGQVEFDDDDVAYATREDAVKALTDVKNIGQGYTLTGNMNAEDEKIIALVVYMPENVGNVANYKTGTTAPEINMGIVLDAAQHTKEKDSYDEYYDVLAANFVKGEVKKAVVENKETVLRIGDFIEVEVPKTATANDHTLNNGDTLTLKVEEKEDAPANYTLTTGAGTKTYDISVVNQNNVKVLDDGDGIKIRIYVGESEAVSVKHIVDGVETDVKNVSFDGEYVTFETGSFSPYVIKTKYVAKIGETKYTDLQIALNNAHNGETVKLLSDYNYDNCDDTPLKYLASTEDITGTLDLNGYTVSATLNNGHSIALLKVGNESPDKAGNVGTATLTIDDTSKDKNGTLTIKPTKYSDAWSVAVETLCIERDGRAILNNGNIITTALDETPADNPYGVLVLTNTGAQTAEFTMNGGYVESKGTTGMGIRVAGNSRTAAAKFTMNGGTAVGADNGRGVWLHNMGGNSLIEVVFNNGTVKADRGVEIGDFNTNTDVSEIIKVAFNGGKFISTNHNNNAHHPDCDVLYTGMASCYNSQFTHVKVTDNRN